MTIAALFVVAFLLVTVGALKRSSAPLNNLIADREFNLSHIQAVHDARALRSPQQHR